MRRQTGRVVEVVEPHLRDALELARCRPELAVRELIALDVPAERLDGQRQGAVLMPPIVVELLRRLPLEPRMSPKNLITKTLLSGSSLAELLARHP